MRVLFQLRPGRCVFKPIITTTKKTRSVLLLADAAFGRSTSFWVFGHGRMASSIAQMPVPTPIISDVKGSSINTNYFDSKSDREKGSIYPQENSVVSVQGNGNGVEAFASEKKIYTYEQTIFSLITPKFASLPFDMSRAKMRTISFKGLRKTINSLYPLFLKQTALEPIDEQSPGFLQKLALVDPDAENIIWFEKLLPPVVHVAGTKGKGSTCMFTDAILREHGLNTVVFTSPHLVSINERIRVNGKPISSDAMQFYTDVVYNYLKERNLLKGNGYFKFLTILVLYMIVCENARLRFFNKRIDALVLEVGIGGLLDSTNVLSGISKKVAGVTLLDYDHMEILGETIEEIAAQKGGIFVKDVPAFTIAARSQQPEALATLQKVALEIGTKLNIVECSPMLVNLELGIPGKHQIVNASLGLEMARSFLEQYPGIDLNIELAKKALAEVKFAGRCQKFQDPIQPNLMFHLDGAHTGKSMLSTVEWFVSLPEVICRSGSNVSIINALAFNCASTKQTKELMKSLIDSSVFQKVLFVKPFSFKPVRTVAPTVDQILGKEEWPEPNPDGNAVPLDAVSWQETLSKVWRRMLSSKKVSSPTSQEIFFKDNIPQSIERLRNFAMENPQSQVNVLVTGSLLLVGDMLKDLGFKEGEA